MMLTILRTAFLGYVRVLLCLQGMYLGFWAWVLWPRRAPHIQSWVPLGLALLFAFLGLAGIVAALLLRRGRRWAAITAIVIEALWAAVAAAFGYKTLKDWPLDWQFLWHVTAAAALFLVAFAGLLLRPVRAYAGLVRARRLQLQQTHVPLETGEIRHVHRDNRADAVGEPVSWPASQSPAIQILAHGATSRDTRRAV